MRKIVSGNHWRNSSGSVCSFPTLPTPGQTCNLPGALDCHYENLVDNFVHEGSTHCCCGQCDTDMTCAFDSDTGSGLWQQMYSSLCPVDGCGSEGELNG